MNQWSYIFILALSVNSLTADAAAASQVPQLEPTTKDSAPLLIPFSSLAPGIVCQSIEISILGDRLAKMDDFKSASWNVEIRFTLLNESEQDRLVAFQLPTSDTKDSASLSISEDRASDAVHPALRQIPEPFLFSHQLPTFGITELNSAWVWTSNLSPLKTKTVTLTFKHRFANMVDEDHEGYAIEIASDPLRRWATRGVPRIEVKLFPAVPFRKLNNQPNTQIRWREDSTNGRGSSMALMWTLAPQKWKNLENFLVPIETRESYINTEFAKLDPRTPSGRHAFEALSPAQRRLLRNTIFAKRGATFHDSLLQEHFGTQWWYEPAADARSETAVDPADPQSTLKTSYSDVERALLKALQSPRK